MKEFNCHEKSSGAYTLKSLVKSLDQLGVNWKASIFARSDAAIRRSDIMTTDSDHAMHIRALYEQIDALWRQLEHHSTAEEHRQRAREFREKAEKLDSYTKELRSDLQSLLKTTHEESTKYINVVSVVGYASYFATWSFTKDLLGREPSAFVGLMGMMSVSFFVLWEMWVILAVRLKSIDELNHVLRNTISAEDFEPLKIRLQENEARRIAIMTPIHRLVFFASFFTAIAGAAAMMQALYASL